MTQIAFLLYDGMTALDAVGPIEVLTRLPDAEARFVAVGPGPRRTDCGLTLSADAAFDDVPAPDVIVVPGSGRTPVFEDPAASAWVRRAAQAATWTTSVCTGATLLGAAGLLEGRRATTHWAVREHLRTYGAEPVADRVVVDGPVVTAAGVSAGVDMALTLAALLAGDDEARAIQLVIEYAPEPPFHAGSLEAAGPEVVRRAGELLARGLEGAGRAY